MGLADLEMIQSSAGEVVPIAVEPSASRPINLIYNGNRSHSTMLEGFLAWFGRRPRDAGTPDESRMVLG